MENSKLLALLNKVNSEGSLEENSFSALDDKMAKKLEMIGGTGNGTCSSNASCTNNTSCSSNDACSSNGTCNGGCGGGIK